MEKTGIRDPLSLAYGLIDDAVKRSPYLLIWASGGKDSNVTFDLVCDRVQTRHPGAHVQAAYMYVVDNVRCIEAPVHVLCKKFGIKLHKLPHFALSDMLRGAVLRHPSVETLTLSSTKMIDVEWAGRIRMAASLSGIKDEEMFKWEEGSEPCPACKARGWKDRPVFKEMMSAGGIRRVPQFDEKHNLVTTRIECEACRGTGRDVWRIPNFKISDLVVDPLKIWSVYGHRMVESLHRRGMLSGFRLLPGGRIGYNPKEMRVYPIAEWKTRQEVMAYTRNRHLPMPPKLGGGVSTGLDLSPDCMVDLHKNHPLDYERVVGVFPLAAAQLMRGEGEEEATT